jgi:hypothetical protein
MGSLPNTPPLPSSGSQVVLPATSSRGEAQRYRHSITWVFAFATLFFFFLVGLALELTLEQRNGADDLHMARLEYLPRGDILKPAMLGYHHLAADVIWLQIVQVFGERTISKEDFAWLRHALDVVTTLDPQYVYAYDVGATVLAEWANRVDWSNDLLRKGMQANPEAWRLPFVLGFNQFFHQHDYVGAAESMAMAARRPKHPYFVEFLATRLYVEGSNPSLALQYLEAMIRQTSDERLRDLYQARYKEVLIVRDIQLLEETVERFTKINNKRPRTLSDLVSAGLLSAIPSEPFGGEYRLDGNTGNVISSTHPERLRLYRPSDHIRFMRQT